VLCLLTDRVVDILTLLLSYEIITINEFSIVSHEETSDHKPNLWQIKWAKTRLQQSRITKFSGGGEERAEQGRGRKGGGGEGRGGRRRQEGI